MFVVEVHISSVLVWIVIFQGLGGALDLRMVGPLQLTQVKIWQILVQVFFQGFNLIIRHTFRIPHVKDGVLLVESSQREILWFTFLINVILHILILLIDCLSLFFSVKHYFSVFQVLFLSSMPEMFPQVEINVSVNQTELIDFLLVLFLTKVVKIPKLATFFLELFIRFPPFIIIFSLNLFDDLKFMMFVVMLMELNL